jgi:mercuric ion transport protein
MKTVNLSSIGTIVASILAASCCIGPAIFVLFGITAGFMGGLDVLVPLSPYFLGAAILLFGFSFWKLYLKRSDCKCEKDFKARKIARGIFWTGAAALLFSVSFQFVLIRLYQ